MEKLIYRELEISEYDKMTKLIKELAKENDYFSFSYEDYEVNEKEQKLFIKKMKEQNNCYIQGAFLNEELIGIVYLYGGNKKRNYHSVTLGIGVLKKYNRNKIGQTLLQLAINYCYDSDVIGKINVQVLKINDKAISFYKKNNFFIEGTEKRALFIDGEFIDAINMGCIID